MENFSLANCTLGYSLYDPKNRFFKTFKIFLNYSLYNNQSFRVLLEAFRVFFAID